jgi:hypothetical protein
MKAKAKPLSIQRQRIHLNANMVMTSEACYIKLSAEVI